MKTLTPLLIALLLSTTAYAGDGNTTIHSFSKAKKILLKPVYPDHKITFYCGCPFTDDKRIVPSESYTPKKEGTRSRRTEWEHIVPASAYGQKFPEWTRGSSSVRQGERKAIQGA
jgi:deoxyribonuclease I